MKSPYDIHLDPNRERTIYPEEEQLIGMSYQFLGWNPEPKDSYELTHCMDVGHPFVSAFPNARKSVQHDLYGEDITQWCTICNIYWKVNIKEHA